jgi:hypothetical protein
MNKEAFYLGKRIEKVEWWISSCNEYPHLYWGRLRVFSDGSADAAFDAESIYGFADQKYAAYFLMEDEYWRLETLEDEQKGELGIMGIAICPPSWEDKQSSKFEYLEKY